VRFSKEFLIENIKASLLGLAFFFGLFFSYEINRHQING